MNRTLLIAATLLLGSASSSQAGNEVNPRKPPFQFSSHGTSILIYQGHKVTSPNNQFFRLHEPGSMTCVGPLTCIITAQGAIASGGHLILVCPHVDGGTAQPDLCSSVSNDHFLASRAVDAGEHHVETKIAFV